MVQTYPSSFTLQDNPDHATKTTDMRDIVEMPALCG